MGFDGGFDETFRRYEYSLRKFVQWNEFIQKLYQILSTLISMNQ